MKEFDGVTIREDLFVTNRQIAEFTNKHGERERVFPLEVLGEARAC